MQDNHTNTVDTKTAIARQLLVCTVALGIVGAGAWSLLGQKAPYHPDIYENEVTRDNSIGILDLNGTN